MAIDVATFKANFPEFQDAPDALVQAQLNYAISMINLPQWGISMSQDLTEQGTFLYCAKYLALSPYARKMALVSKEGKTIYDDRLRQLVRIAASGHRVL